MAAVERLEGQLGNTPAVQKLEGSKPAVEKLEGQVANAPPSPRAEVEPPMPQKNDENPQGPGGGDFLGMLKGFRDAIRSSKGSAAAPAAEKQQPDAPALAAEKLAAPQEAVLPPLPAPQPQPSGPPQPRAEPKVVAAVAPPTAKLQHSVRRTQTKIVQKPVGSTRPVILHDHVITNDERALANSQDDDDDEDGDEDDDDTVSPDEDDSDHHF